MALQTVTITEQDGALGSLPAGQKALALVGVANGAGTLALNTPAAYARTTQIASALARGPLAHAAATAIKRFNRPVLVVRADQSAVATVSGVSHTTPGTSVVTVSGGTLPDDDYELLVQVILGGTVGTGPITLQSSLDGGRTMSADFSLGTANSFTIPSSNKSGSEVTLAFAAGTLVTGDVIAIRANAPNWDTTTLGAALTALFQSALDWDECEIVGPIDSTALTAIETAFASHSEKTWHANTRIPNDAESDATYTSSLTSEFASVSTVIGDVCAGAARIVSGLDSRVYRRPIVHAVAPLSAANSEEVDISAPDLGTVVGVSIVGSDGNPIDLVHNEELTPGLDDQRFTTLRTWDGLAGVFVTNPRIKSAAGSDFEFIQHRKVMNLARRTLRIYFTRRLSKPVRVSATTGFILESEALEIERGADAVMRAALLAKPKASGGGIDGKIQRFVSLSRTDNLLSTKTMTVQASVIPLAYPKAIEISLGFKNPALQVLQV